LIGWKLLKNALEGLKVAFYHKKSEAMELIFTVDVSLFFFAGAITIMQ